MTDVYEKLAKHLDKLPAGFPASETGVELRILKRLFTPEEAKIAASLILMPETADDIAERLDEKVENLEEILETMSRRGLIFRMKKGDRTLYMPAQFMIGIWEYHVNDLDEDFIKDMNEYIPTLLNKSWLKIPTKQLRVVPVSKSIGAEMKIMPYEAAEKIVREQKKIAVAPCICRKEHAFFDKACDRLMDACLIFDAAADYYEGNGLGRIISQDEAIEILNKASEQGLVLQPGNSKKPVNICLCCGCCCQILKNLKTLDEPSKAVCTNFYAVVDQDRCVGCGECAERCQMDAVEIHDTAQISLKRCIGCGLCVPTCEYEAIHLVEKEEAEKFVPPKNAYYTFKQMTRERGITD